jgi:uncharacterized membrane protein YfcA
MAAQNIRFVYDWSCGKDDFLMLLFFIGFLSGMIGGMGIGGGTILIPSMIFFAGVSQHVAQGINLVSFIPTALAAVLVHIKNKHIRFKLAINLLLTGAIGAIIGSLFALQIPGKLLRQLFGGLLLIMGIFELLRKKKKKEKSRNSGSDKRL